MALKVNSDIALTGSLTVSGSYGLAAADIPSLAASKITSGTFAAARIPSLAASKITSGTFADARIASAANWNTAYGWGNHASAGYSTFDGAYDSLTGRPTIPTNNNQLTNGAGYLTSVPTTLSGNRTIGGDLTVSGNQVITAGSNADVKFSVWSGTTYGIGMTSGVTYGGLNDYAMTFCMNNDSDRGFWWGYSGQSKSAGAMSLTTGGNLTLAGNASISGTISASGYNDSNWNTAYSWGNHASAGYITGVAWNDITGKPTLDNYVSWNLKTGGTQRTTVGSGGTLDIVGGTNVSVAYSAGGVVTISSTDTNTTYSVGDGGLTQKNFTTTLKNKLDGIATSADAYGGWNISDGTNSEKIQANNTLTVQGGGSASVSYDSGNNTLTVNATDTNTTYSTATSSTLGLVKIGYAENGKNYPVELSSGKMFVNVPWTDTNTDTDTITRVGTAGNQISGDITIAASGAASVSQSGGTITISATNTTYSEYNGGSAGLVPGGSGGTGKFLQEDGQWAIPQDTNTTYSAGAGLDLSGTTFSVEGNLSGDVYAIGRDGNDKYVVNTTNHAWYLDGVLDMRLNNNGNLDVDGDVIAYSTVTSSDRKLKTNIQTLENASEKVKALRGVSFTWDHGKKAGKEDIGLIAQEVEEVVPEIVGEAELLDGTMAKHVDYPKLVALLIESNKELMARVETLEAKLNGITE